LTYLCIIYFEIWQPLWSKAGKNCNINHNKRTG
jgi:hypothetical protein